MKSENYYTTGPFMKSENYYTTGPFIISTFMSPSNYNAQNASFH